MWACNPLVQLYKPSLRKRLTLPLKRKFNQSLPDSTIDSNSFNSIQYLDSAVKLFLPFSHVPILNLFPANSLSLKLHFHCILSIYFHLMQSLSCQPNYKSNHYYSSFICVIRNFYSRLVSNRFRIWKRSEIEKV